MEKLSNLKRIDWIDGLKGISCIFIFIHHYFLNFYPASYYGISKPSKLNGIDTYLSSSPLGLFLNGNFFVFLFILLSGYVMTYQIANIKEKNKIGVLYLKKYVIYVIQIFTYVIIFEICNFLIRDLKPHSILKIIKSSVYSILTKGDTTFGGHLWMLDVIFMGGILLTLLATVYWKWGNLKTLVFFVGMTIYLCLFGKVLHSALFAGGTLYLWKELNIPLFTNKKVNIILYTSILPLGLFFGGYPSGVVPNNIYSFITFPFAPHQYYHLLGAFLIVFGIQQLDSMQLLLSSRIPLFMSSISFNFYLFHDAVISYTNELIIKITPNTGYYFTTTMIFLIIGVLFICAFTHLYQKYFMSKLVNKVKNFF